MSFGEFWQQPNKRRFNIDGTNEINLSELSKQLNVSENMLESIFTKHDTNKNGKLESSTSFENELENFLQDVNATFTTKNQDNNKVVRYTDALEREVTEVYNQQGKLIEKTMLFRNNTPPSDYELEKTNTRNYYGTIIVTKDDKLSSIEQDEYKITYTYKSDCVEITTPDETYTVKKIQPDGNFLADDFIKKTSLQCLTKEAALSLADDVDKFAKLEGLTMHAYSASVRKE